MIFWPTTRISSVRTARHPGARRPARSDPPPATGGSKNFLVNAQLARRVATWLADAGCNAIHTVDLSDANRTTDEQISDLDKHSNSIGFRICAISSSWSVGSRKLPGSLLSS